MWALLGTALAGSIAGTTIPGSGGSFSGITEPGARGVLYQPTATNRGEAPELLVDVAAVNTYFAINLDGWETPEISRGTSMQPTIALSFPVRGIAEDRLSFGAGLHSMYQRGTDYGDYPRTRLFGINSTYSLIEVDVSTAVRATDFLTLGAGLRLGQMTYASHKGTDLASTLNRAVDLDPPLPLGDPLFAGTQTIFQMSRSSASFIFGATVEVEDIQIDVSYRPQWALPMRGAVQIVPSQAFDTSIDGTIDLTIKVPTHVLVGARIPASDKWLLIPEIEYVGWKRASRSTAVVSGLRLGSSDPTFNDLIATAGLTEADFIKSQEGAQQANLGWGDVINIAAQGVYQAREDIEIRGGAGFSPSAIPEPVTTPANVDFGSIWFRAGAAWRIAQPIRVSLAGERYQALTRRVDESPYSLINPQPGQPVQPSGNGVYAFGLWRAGLTVQLFWPEGVL